LKGFVERSLREKKGVTSATSLTGINSTNATSVLHEGTSLDQGSNIHGSAKSRKTKRPYIPLLKIKMIQGSN